MGERTDEAAGAVPRAKRGTLRDELRVVRQGDRFHRDIATKWSFGDDRVFGGYLGAISLQAASDIAEMPVVLSCAITFAAPVRPGTVDIEARVLQRSRAAAAVQATILQEGRAAVVVNAWLTTAMLSGAVAPPVSVTAPHPESCPAIEYRHRYLAFTAAFEERGIVYPESMEKFHSGPALVDLWMRPGIETGTLDPLTSQLFDVMALDSHMFDAPRSAWPSPHVFTASLDLAVQWYATIPLTSWRRIRTEAGPAGGGFAATSGLILNEQSQVVARAMQQGRIRAMQP